MRVIMKPVTPVCFEQSKISGRCTGTRDSLCAYCRLNKKWS